MNCPRDGAELELVDEGMTWQKLKCPVCKMKIHLEEGDDE